MTVEPERKSERKCALGFHCASMMQVPALDAADCPNHDTCRSASGLPPDDLFEFRMAGETGEVGTIYLSRIEAAILMLKRRGCPATPDRLGITGELESLLSRVEEIRSALDGFEGRYIAPPDTRVHSYRVKRERVRLGSDGSESYTVSYEYFKLASPEPIFAPSERDRPVHVIHLSKEGDPRHVEASRGIDRRDRLLRARDEIREAIARLGKALEVLAEE